MDDHKLREYREMIEAFLSACPALSDVPYRRLLESMHYSVTAGGKRLRPILTLEFCRVCGGDVHAALPVACSVELLHTYTLIHDDLPCMDDDALRRGKPSNHIVFGECTATLAGDALQACSFETVLSAPLPSERVLRCAQLLSSAAGSEGVCGGQQLDLEWEGRALSRDELLYIHSRKTGALIRAACLMGVTAAGGDEKALSAADAYATALGLAFQIRDDMLDVIGDEKEFGKPIGSDRGEQKATFVDLLGLEGCAREVERLTAEAEAALDGLADTQTLRALARELMDRRA